MKKGNFKDIKLQGVDNVTLEDAKVHELVRNRVYNFTKDVGRLELAQKIYAGNEVELRKTDIAEIKRLLDIPQSNLLAYTKKAVLDALEKSE